MSRIVNVSTSPTRSLDGEQEMVDVVFLRPGGFTTSEPPVDHLDQTSTFRIPGEYAAALMPAMTEQPSRHKGPGGSMVPCGRFDGNYRYKQADGEWYELAMIINIDIPLFTVRYQCKTKMPLWYARYLTQGTAGAFFKIVNADTEARFQAYPYVEDAGEDSEPLVAVVDPETAALKQELANARRKITRLENKDDKKGDKPEDAKDPADDGKKGEGAELNTGAKGGGTAQGQAPGGTK